ncbi:spermidine synthase-like protein [Pseudoflavitalea sp. X16]|uniref:spermidine synthase-like protein n=1 Tax=Paraflavitalea devenefica TaxID=2716334 RepID=UPI0014229E14|nr:spermidine synthase-like protein [Paraflavitalea devenefica]NII29719.1 spermidine synthase-like protein [Paraflavitalea devenefica]
MVYIAIRGRLLLSLGMLSAAIIAFQLALMQVLSIVQWHHFAYMVISMALLGFGAGGTLLSLFRQRLLKRIHWLLPVLMISCGITMSLVIYVSQFAFIRFDSYLLFANYAHIGRLLLTYLLFFIPFLLGALAIGLIFDHYVALIGKVYFANLLGSAAGGLLLLALLYFLLPHRLPAFISFLPVIAGTMIIPVDHESSRFKNKVALFLFAFIAFISCTGSIIIPPQLQLSQFKDISKALLLPDARIKLEKASPYGPIQAVTSPVLRYAPGLSLLASQPVNASTAVFINGDWVGAVTGSSQPDTAFILNYTSFDLPYRMADRKDVLVLQAGAGIAVAHALSHHATQVVAVEPNAILVAALKHELAADNDSLFYQPAVTVHTQEPRNFLFSDTTHYDLISLPVAGSFGGSAGLYSLHEQFILTKEAFLSMWPRLKEGGAISITAWMDYPARNPLKLLATLTEALEQLNIRQPQHHIAAIRSWGTISFVVTKSALTGTEIRNIRNFCNQWQFDPALLPGLQPTERARYHQLQDSSFFQNMDQLLSTGRDSLYADYDFNIRPAIDNSPYFSQFIRWKSLPRLAEYFGNRSIPFFEIGYVLVVITLVQIALISFVLVLLPLFKPGWKDKSKPGVLLYFGGIGLGYMFVEMVFIQHFTFYFGHPVYAAAAVITALLLFSGLGSFVSGRLEGKRKLLLLVFTVIIVLLFIYAAVLMPLLRQTAQSGLPVKLLIVFLLMAPLAFCMGIPFPAGLSQLARTQSPAIPWAWGLNGCMSVISAALATLIAVEAGFTMVMWLAAFAYCLPLIVLIFYLI